MLAAATHIYIVLFVSIALWQVAHVKKMEAVDCWILVISVVGL
jgi:hypothetical protein